jgi:HD-like signal output (HDOD) protein
MRIAHLFEHAHALPSIPKVVHQMIQSFSREDISLDEITDQLSADPVISAKVLRLANSAYFHVSHKVSTVDDALRMLGFVMVRNLVVGSGLAGGFKMAPGMDLPKFWSYSLQTAVTARWLAKTTKDNGDLGFTVGLIHAIGQLVMHAAMPEQMLHIDRIVHPLDARRIDIEEQTFGYTFSEVGAELAKRWHFPDDIVEAIRSTVDPASHPDASRIAMIVHLGAWRARMEAHGWGAEEMAATYPEEIGARIGLAPTWLPELAAQQPASVPRIDVMPDLDTLCGDLKSLMH